MNQIDPEKILGSAPKYKDLARAVSRGIHTEVLQGGPPVREAADFLHGSWLGHPLHSVLTDVTVGAWVLGALFDLLGLTSRSAREAGDRLAEIGAASAVPTALSGLTDFSTIPRRAMATGATHGLINMVVLLLYLASIRRRRSGARPAGLFISGLALGLATVSAWLGGELVYKYRVGVNKSEKPSEPQGWTAVIDETALAIETPARVEVNGLPVLLYRQDGAVYAIGAVCGHDGGPLDEGKVEGLCVECPWHQSVYDLRDGRVVHGPSTYQVAAYDARILNGKIELRIKEV